MKKSTRRSKSGEQGDGISEDMMSLSPAEIKAFNSKSSPTTKKKQPAKPRSKK